MYIDLLNNLAITSVLLFILGRFLIHHPLDSKTPLNIKIYIGLLSGIIGVILMLSTIKINDTVILDVRSLAILIAAIFGGPVAAILSGVIIGVMRIVIFGVTFVSVTACILAISIGIILGLFTKLNISKIPRYILMNITYVTLTSMTIYFLINNPAISINVLANYWAVSAVGGFFIYFFIEYIMKSNENHRSIFYFKQITDNATDLVSTHDVDGKFRYLSPSSFHLLHYKPEELVGKSPYNYYHPDDLMAINQSHNAVIMNSDKSTIRYRFKRKDGEYIWLETISKTVKGITNEKDEIICISRDITLQKQVEDKLQEINAKLEHLAIMDGLTDIPNRRAFDQRIEEEWKRMTRNAKPLSLIMLDIDNFKVYNDTYGHLQGDDCIIKIAKTAQMILNRPSDFIARYGGEEFAVILPETNKEGAIRVAESMRKAIQALAIVHVNSKVKPYVTISLGVTTMVPTADSNFTQLIISADEALYKAKNAGRNQVEFQL